MPVPGTEVSGRRDVCFLLAISFQEDVMMDLSPEMWVVVILLATAVGGAVMWWSSTPRKKH
jgi:hypothetical protein